MKYIFSTILVLMSLVVLSQEVTLPQDFLNKDFHRERREKLREKLPHNSVAVFFANPVRNRANDVDYIYHQDPDLYYLTGYKEPHAVLLVFKEDQEGPNNSKYNEVFFVQPLDPLREMWTGRRMGSEKVKEQLGILAAFDNKDFRAYKIDFSKFDKVLFFDFKNDVRDNPSDSGDLYSLIEQFKEKANYPVKNEAKVHHIEDQKNNLNVTELEDIMDDLRGTKTPEELKLIRKAISISCQGQIEVMKAIKPGMSEREVQGIHEYVFKKYQAEDVGYPSIVGGGHNGCILHYIENYKPNLHPKELILMDLGAEYHGYTADITRTIPVKGTFSKEQKQIYDLVLKAQEKAMKICKAGSSFSDLTAMTKNVVNEGLVELGIIKDADQQHLYYPHGCCHHIGLDVHDRGSYGTLEKNMVITIEPGIYINENSDCDKKWWGIAVRIEDDFLVQKNGCELMSKSAPRTTEEIEKLMAQPSPLDNFTLPELD